jgi:hypothetical protein
MLAQLEVKDSLEEVREVQAERLNLGGLERVRAASNPLLLWLSTLFTGVRSVFRREIETILQAFA